MRRALLPPVLTLALVCAAGVFASLGYWAISERHIAVAGKGGEYSLDGLRAVLRGWVFFAGALAILGVFAIPSRFRRLIWLALAILWLAAAAAYFAWFY
jgi:glucan phosphoethanolaminetransferase (alkaline phosphatase superfamily)